MTAQMSRRSFFSKSALAAAAVLSLSGIAQTAAPKFIDVYRYDGRLDEPCLINWMDMVPGDIVTFGDENGKLRQVEELPYITGPGDDAMCVKLSF